MASSYGPNRLKQLARFHSQSRCLFGCALDCIGLESPGWSANESQPSLHTSVTIDTAQSGPNGRVWLPVPRLSIVGIVAPFTALGLLCRRRARHIFSVHISVEPVHSPFAMLSLRTTKIIDGGKPIIVRQGPEQTLLDQRLELLAKFKFWWLHHIDDAALVHAVFKNIRIGPIVIEVAHCVTVAISRANWPIG